MNDENKEKIILPEKLQKEMLDFFLKTSIPRKKQLKEKEELHKERLLSEKTDRSKQNGN